VSGVRVTTTLRPRDVFGVSLWLLIAHPVSLTLMAAGPVLLAGGALSGSVAVEHLGETMAWLVALVPAFGVLAATYAAYRPGSGSLYESASWDFTDDGVIVSREAGDTRAEWPDFTGWRSVAGFLLLHTSGARYAVIPWRDVPPGARAGLEDLLATRIGLRRR
jgi:hypothetical protein